MEKRKQIKRDLIERMIREHVSFPLYFRNEGQLSPITASFKNFVLDSNGTRIQTLIINNSTARKVVGHGIMNRDFLYIEGMFQTQKNRHPEFFTKFLINKYHESKNKE